MGHNTRILLNVSRRKSTRVQQRIQRKKPLRTTHSIKGTLQNQLESELIQNFDEAMSLREEADYGLIFSEEGATSIVNNAEKFLKRVKEILRI